MFLFYGSEWLQWTQHEAQCNQSLSTHGDTLCIVDHTDIGHFLPHKSARGGESHTQG